MWGLRLRRAQLTICINTACQQIVQQALLDGFELLNDDFGSVYGCIDSINYVSYLDLLFQRDIGYKPRQSFFGGGSCMTIG